MPGDVGSARRRTPHPTLVRSAARSAHRGRAHGPGRPPSSPWTALDFQRYILPNCPVPGEPLVPGWTPMPPAPPAPPVLALALLLAMVALVTLRVPAPA